MNTTLLISTEETIANEIVPSQGKLFAGAHLIISKTPRPRGYKHHDGDVIVISPYASEISWVVFQLKEIFAEDMDLLPGWKYEFYPSLGEAAIRAISQACDKRGILTNIVNTSKNLFSNRRNTVGPHQF
jgi:hypothetical protein